MCHCCPAPAGAPPRDELYASSSCVAARRLKPKARRRAQLQRAAVGWLLCVVLWLCAVPRADALVTIAVDIRSLPKITYQQYQILPLYRKLVVRLTEAGFAVVGPQQRSQLRVSLQVSPKGLLLLVQGAGQRVSRVLAKRQDSIAQFHLEILHKGLTAARRLQAMVPPKASNPKGQTPRTPPPRRASPRRTPPTLPKGKDKGGRRASLRRRQVPLPPPKPSRWRAEIDLGAFVQYRVQAADFLARLGFRWGQERGFGLYTSLSIAPSLSDAITIIEWGLQIGPTWRQPIASAFSLEFGLLVGFVHHRFYFGQGEGVQGDRGDFLGSLLVLGNWQIAPSVGFRLWLALGLSFQSRIHRVDGAVIWERSLFRLEGGGAFYLSF